LDPNALNFQQARIKQILFKSQLRSVLYGVREASDALFSPRENALGQWLTTVVKPQYGARPEMREADRLLRQMLETGRELVTQYQRGHIEEARGGLGRIDAHGEQLLAVLSRLASGAQA
jgi:hypothetical protein